MTESVLEPADSPFKRFRLGGATEHQLDMLATALREAPELDRRVTEAMNLSNFRHGDFTRIGVLEADGNLGEYSSGDRMISFRPDVLNARIDQEGVDRLVDVFSHEITHALNRRHMNQFDDDIERQAYALAGQPGPRDGTALVQAYIDKGREQEALAELAGINGLADRIRAEGKGVVTESALAERLFRAGTSSCVEQAGPDGYRFKDGIEFDPVTQSVQATPKNLGAVAKHFVDIDRGLHDYKAFYAAAAISAIARAEIAQREQNPLLPMAQTRIDLAALGVNPEDLRAQEFNFGINPPGPFAFTDSSAGRQTIMEIAHTAKPGSWENAPELSVGDAELMQRMWQKVQASGAWDEVQAGNIAAALLLETRRDPMLQRVDDVAVGSGRDGTQRAFGVYRPYGDKPPTLHADVDMAKAAQQPMQDSLTELAAVNQQVALVQQQEQQRKGQEETQRREQGSNPDPVPTLVR